MADAAQPGVEPERPRRQRAPAAGHPPFALVGGGFDVQSDHSVCKVIMAPGCPIGIAVRRTCACLQDERHSPRLLLAAVIAMWLNGRAKARRLQQRARCCFCGARETS
eukprot:14937789-Alexandrium_andersonii.AAC.2